MRRVLIFADIFPPAFAPRVAYLVKYLPRFGWEPYVVTEKMPEASAQSHGNVFAGFLDNVPLLRVDLTKSSNFFQKISRQFGELIFERKDRQFYMEASRAFPGVHFDAVLCLTYRKFPLFSAYSYARTHKLPWIADCRDIVEQYSRYNFLPQKKRFPLVVMKWLQKRYISLRNRYLQHADRVVSVSPWHCRLLASVNRQTKLIYNGFDPDVFCRGTSKNDKFIIIYTGRLLSLDMHNPILLFEALSGAEFSEIVKGSKIEIHWYVDEYSQTILKPLLDMYGLTDICRFFSMVPTLEIPDLLRRSSILLHLGNLEKEGGPHGIVSTKLFEYLAIGKPILMVRSDEAIVADILLKARAGLAAQTSEEVCDFLMRHYARWKKEGDTSLSSQDWSFISSFSRIEGARQYAELLDSIVTN